MVQYSLKKTFLSISHTHARTVKHTLTVKPLVPFHGGVLVAGTQQFLLVLLYQTVETVAIAALDPLLCHLTFLKKQKKKKMKTVVREIN